MALPTAITRFFLLTAPFALPFLALTRNFPLTAIAAVDNAFAAIGAII
ncbi:hypothetical protein [Paenibacillus plantiphilus]|nr:hypothetical protein [Paenibacillus plantiphilus]